MIIDRPAPVTDRITLMGRQESCVYLLDGKTSFAIIGGGMSYIVPDIVSQLDSLRIDRASIERLVILHTHFDHVGIAPFMKGLMPGLKICASARGREQLVRPEVISVIVDFNRSLVAANWPEADEKDFGIPFDRIEVDEELRDSEQITVGDLTLQVLEVPGHSSCSIALYCPQQKALFASDAGGIPFRGMVFASANSNFDKYQESLEKMARLDVEVHCAEHYGALTGDDGRSFMARSIESARITRRLIEETYLKTKDTARTTSEITELFLKEGSGYFLPREVMEMVVGQMTRYLAKTL